MGHGEFADTQSKGTFFKENRMGTWRSIFFLALFSMTCAAVFAADGAEEKLHMRYQWSIDANYPRLDDEKLDEELRRQLGAWLTEAITEVAEVAEPAPENPEGSWDMDVDYSISRPSDGAVSVVFDYSSYPSGAAHPMSGVRVVNLATKDGRLVTPDALFRDPEKALEILAANAPGLVKAQMREENPDLFPEEPDEETFFMEGFLPTPENYANLSLEPEGVRVHFQLYQILPYVFGMADPLVPLKLLEPAGPNAEFWPGS